MVYFDKASTDLVPGQSGSIQNIADELAGKPQQVEIVATASNQPLPPGCSFRDRWELGYARCRQTAELFTSLKIEPERLAAVGLAGQSLRQGNEVAEAGRSEGFSRGRRRRAGLSQRHAAGGVK